jgi:phage terminase large subunit-like protein
VGVQARGNAIIATKQASGTVKIDPLMAAFNAIAWMAAIPVSATEHILDLM